MKITFGQINQDLGEKFKIQINEYKMNNQTTKS